MKHGRIQNVQVVKVLYITFIRDIKRYKKIYREYIDTAYATFTREPHARSDAGDSHVQAGKNTIESLCFSVHPSFM